MVVKRRGLRWWLPWFALVVLGLGACATPPLLPPDPIGPQVTPRAAAAVMGPLPTEQLWGGVIVGLQNRPDYTRIEVVSYPLRRQEPLTERMTNGRFLLEVPGFLDPLDHRSGRRITARGPVVRTEAGRIGEVDYVFPVMDAREYHLWPEESSRGQGYGPVRFGVGIGIGL